MQKLVASHLCPRTALTDGYLHAHEEEVSQSQSAEVLTEYSSSKKSQHNSEVVRVVADMIAVRCRV